MESMEHPIPEDFRQCLIKNFRDVRDEPMQGDYFVFSLKTNSGQPRTLRAHRNYFIYSKVVTAFLQKLVGDLERGDVDLEEPSHRGSPSGGR